MVLGGGHTQAAARLHLPLVDGADTGADDLRHIGAGKDRQRGDPGGEAIEVQHGADKEVDDEDLHQQRRATDQPPRK